MSRNRSSTKWHVNAQFTKKLPTLGNNALSASLEHRAAFWTLTNVDSLSHQDELWLPALDHPAQRRAGVHPNTDPPASERPIRRRHELHCPQHVLRAQHEHRQVTLHTHHMQFCRCAVRCRRALFGKGWRSSEGVRLASPNQKLHLKQCPQYRG